LAKVEFSTMKFSKVLAAGKMKERNEMKSVCSIIKLFHFSVFRLAKPSPMKKLNVQALDGPEEKLDEDENIPGKLRVEFLKF
jgi:hypothetical protein